MTSSNLNERSQALLNSDIPLSDQLCHAACDVIRAQRYSEFRNEFGDVDTMLQDLAYWVDRWMQEQPPMTD